MVTVLSLGSQMTVHEIAVGIAQVHAVTFAKAPKRTVGTFATFHPVTVAVLAEAVLPHIPEIILVNIALPVVGADTRTCTDAAVKQYRGNAYACLTVEEIIPHFSFISCKESLTAERCVYFSFFTGVNDKLHKGLDFSS